MSDQQQATELKPLWTDEMIRYEVEGWQLNCIESEIPVVQDLMKKMRGPYEAERDQLKRKVDEAKALASDLYTALAVRENCEAHIRDLEADLRVERNYATALEKVIDMLEEDKHDE